MIARLVCAAAVALGIAVAPALAQTGSGPTGGKAPLPADAPGASNGSRPVAPAAQGPGGAPGGAPGAAGGQRIDAIFEALPPSFTRSVVFNADNLHFVPIKTPKGNIVLVWGGVGQGDAIRFSAAMQAAKPVIEVQLYSPGGLLYEGMKIGRIVRSLGLATRITSGSTCASACDFMFLGGTVRTVEPQGNFGVHMFSDDSTMALLKDLEEVPGSVDEFNDRFPKHAVKRYEVTKWVEAENARDPTNKVTERNFFQQGKVYKSIVDERVRDIQQYSARTAADIALFLVEMRLSLRFLVEFSDQTSYGMRYLNAEELRSYNVVTN